MKATDLVEVAALLATHGPSLIRGDYRLSASGIQRYWIASKCRLERWTRSLKNYNQCVESTCLASAQIDGDWTHVRGAIEEILSGEVFTRVWTGIARGIDRHRGRDEVQPTAHSVLVGHREACHRVMKLLVNPYAIPDNEALWLNRLRRRAERWTDLLVAYLIDAADVSDLAMNPELAREFAADFREGNTRDTRQYDQPLLAASLRSAFRRCTKGPSPNADLNAQIATSVLSCFPPEIFESVGCVESLWQMRLNNSTADAHALVSQMLQLEQPGTSSWQLTPESPR